MPTNLAGHVLCIAHAHDNTSVSHVLYIAHARLNLPPAMHGTCGPNCNDAPTKFLRIPNRTDTDMRYVILMGGCSLRPAQLFMGGRAAALPQKPHPRTQNIKIPDHFRNRTDRPKATLILVVHVYFLLHKLSLRDEDRSHDERTFASLMGCLMKT